MSDRRIPLTELEDHGEFTRRHIGPDEAEVRAMLADLELSSLDELVERSLRSAALWDEVKDKLRSSGLGLSGGQQQRLCIARAMATGPDLILMDEPTSALDPVATDRIERLIHEIKERYTVIIVTHNMQQAGRVSDVTAFMHLGQVVEVAPTDDIFTNPRHELTERYVTGRFG